MFCCMNFFTLDENSKGTRGTCANWLRLGVIGILPSISFQIKLSTGGICWISGLLMLPAFKSRLVHIRDNRVGFFVD